MSRTIFKEAETTAELRQIHTINHRVFAEEFAQHRTNSSNLLVDYFNDSNIYFVAVRGEKVIEMISAHSGLEFSVTEETVRPDCSPKF